MVIWGVDKISLKSRNKYSPVINTASGTVKHEYYSFHNFASCDVVQAVFFVKLPKNTDQNSESAVKIDPSIPK